VVGFEPSEGATIALLTVLDVGTGAPLPIFAPSGFVRLATPRAMPAVPMAVSAAGNGDLVIAGSTGIDGGSLFVGRVAASSVRPLR